MEEINTSRAIVLIQQGKFDLAEKELRRVLSADLDNGEAHAFLALCLVNQKKITEAMAEVQQAIALEPEMPFAFYLKSLIHLQEEETGPAEAAIREALQLDPYDPDFYNILAGIQFNRKRYQEALATAEEGLALDAEHVDCLNLRARAMNRLGRPELAAESFENAFYQDPENAMTHANQGWTYLERNDHKKSLQHFQEALKLQPNSEYAREGLVEALKAKYWIYRAVLQFSFKMQTLSSGARWGLTIGMLILIRVMPLLLPFYMLLIFFTWFSDMIFNTLLRFNSYGRQALDREQIFGSNLFLALFGGGLTAGALGFFLPDSFLIGVGMVLLGWLFPMAGTLSLSNKKSRRKSLWASLALVAVGVVYLGAILFQPTATGNIFKVFFYGLIAYTWFRASL